MKDSEAAVNTVIDAYREAVFNRDADALMRLYDASVRVFDAWDVWSCEGADAWGVSVHGWLASLGEDRVRVTTEDIQVHGAAPLLVASAVFRYAAFDPAGQALRALQNRLTWALRWDGEAWKIVHEHTSMPIAHEDAKAIFERRSAT